MPPPLAVATTAYCVSSVRTGTVRGSTRTPEPGVRATVCVVASVPSAKRYQFSVALVAVDDCSRIGVVQPFAPPRVRVMFGRKYLGVACVSAVYPIALAEPITETAAAIEVPPALTSTVYSPSARQPVVAVAPQRGRVGSPLVVRRAKATELPAPA